MVKKRIITLFVSIALIISSIIPVGITANAATYYVSGTTKSVSSGQYMTYMGTYGDYYQVRLYNETSNGYSTNGAIGYVLKSDLRTTYFNYGRPWTNPYSAIYYGASYISTSYSKYQNTGYLQKFNVNSESGNLYSHEYMANVCAAADESVTTYNAYKNASVLSTKKVFYIPVYSNMPSGNCSVNGDTTNNSKVSTTEYAKVLKAKGFPDSYINPLVALHEKYPNWEFYVFDTGLSWSTAVSGERSKHKQQLIQKASGRSTAYYCKCSSCYKNSAYVIQEGSSWISASENAVKYYMDPRNWMTEKYIFQFESTSYDSAQSTSGVESILSSTWMHNSNITYYDTYGNTKTYTDSKSNKVKYSTAIMDAAKYSGMSAYYLASKIVQEVGASTAKATGVCGTKAPFTGIYNYYNIGANTGAVDGLAWAAGFLKANKNTTLYSSCEKAPSVSGVSVSAKTYDSITLKWNKNTNASGYYVYQYNSSKKKYTRLATINSNSTVSYKISNLTPSTKYTYVVCAYKTENGSTVTGPYSSQASATTDSAVSKVSGLDVASQNSTSITLKWKKCSDASGYYIYKYTPSSKKYTKLATIDKNSTVSYKASKLNAGTSYSYAVQSYVVKNGKTFTGAYSSILNTATKPSVPTIKNPTTNSKHQITVKWTALKSGSGYQVQFSRNKNFKKVIATKTVSDISKTSYTGKNFTKGVTYYVRVRAYKTVDGNKIYSSWSTVKSVKSK